MTAGVLKTAEKYVHFNVPGVFIFVYYTAAFTGNVNTGHVNLQKSIDNVPAVWRKKKKKGHLLVMLSIFNSAGSFSFSRG